MERERREGFGFAGEKVEEVPLRHETDEFAVRRQTGEIGHGCDVAIEDPPQLGEFLMRELEKFFQQPELVHELESGRMNGVAAKIAVEISMLFQDRHFHTCARQQVTGHHSGGSATDDDATSADVRLRIHGIWKLI